VDEELQRQARAHTVQSGAEKTGDTRTFGLPLFVHLARMRPHGHGRLLTFLSRSSPGRASSSRLVHEREGSVHAQLVSPSLAGQRPVLLAEASWRNRNRRSADGPASLCHASRDATARRGTSSRMDLKALARDLGRDLMAGNRAAWATVVVSVFFGEPQEQTHVPEGPGLVHTRALHLFGRVCYPVPASVSSRPT
jgi:hypothetical protein